MEILKIEQYVVFKPESEDFDATLASQIEKNIAGMYSAEGRINFIIDLTSVKEFTSAGIVLFNKVQKICKNESGLLVLVTTDDNLIDTISTQAEDFLLILPSQEEAIDAVFMNELENDFKDEQEDEFGMDGESDY
ncbi:anti-anti-sigma factor [Lacihabitans sp. LS3-19]|uniref:STAS domain-containing protein n=1 Tax=Lacihabitans sp. LS3-19 TaxID=2487335 RepID=UPI0020CE8E4C|nr:STAS domain-containing protein [Lacihabitans sp. LS3-19]MCP9767015.1 anti-anti-sigma factor [Lacihabitans sp. LS3-19]